MLKKFSACSCALLCIVRCIVQNKLSINVRNGLERSSYWLPFLVHCPDWFLTAMPKTTTMPTPSDRGVQVSLHILGHELICLSCWMNWIIPYLDPKLDCLEMTSFEVRMQLHAFNLPYDHSRSLILSWGKMRSRSNAYAEIANVTGSPWKLCSTTRCFWSVWSLRANKSHELSHSSQLKRCECYDCRSNPVGKSPVLLALQRCFF